MNNKAQVWTTDFIFGFIIFSIGLLLASRFIYSSLSDNDFASVKANSESMSEYLISSGVPENWTNKTVVRVGLTTNKRLNLTKVEMFYNLSYGDTKSYLNADYDYLLYFIRNGSVLNLTKCGYGYVNVTNCSVNISGIEYDDLVKTTRFVLFNSTIIEMVLFVWQ